MTEEQFKLSEGAVAWRQVDGETILLDLAASAYLGANPSGSALWSTLADGATRQELVEQLCETFDVPEDRAGPDVDAFLRACRDRGFLAVSVNPVAETKPRPGFARPDGSPRRVSVRRTDPTC